MKKLTKDFMRYFIAIILCLVSVISGQLSLSAFPVYAVEKAYSSLVEDLQKDSSFDSSYYPEKENDYSIQIIQLAESVDKELFIYTYQPSCDKFKATSINISTTINDDISFYNYKLELLSGSGTLFKYKVTDFTVKNENTRYYVITSIYRPFDKNIDKEPSGGNSSSETECAVSKQYCFSEINGKPFVSCIDIETIEIPDKFVGFVRYESGFNLYKDACDSHFVAFSTDKPIDRLFEAEVFYSQRSRIWRGATIGVKETETLGDKVSERVLINDEEQGVHKGDGAFAGTYTWDRIQTVNDFINGEDIETVYKGSVFDVTVGTKLTDETLKELKNMQWVLRFAETNYHLSDIGGRVEERSTVVGDVTILRLKFETDGITYNLGVIDNKQSGSDKPSNDTETDVSIDEDFLKKILKILEIILKILPLVLLVIIISPILPHVISLLIKIVLLPFKTIAAIIKACKKNKNKKE